MRFQKLTAYFLSSFLFLSSYALADGEMLGDVNQDGNVNLLDVGPFVDAVSAGEYQVEADLDENGVVDLLDVEPFVAALSGGPLTMILRDSIGLDSSLTDGNPGASAGTDGGIWARPGFVIDVPVTGTLKQIKFVMFARDGNTLPENNINNIAGYPMEFNVWSDGIFDLPDSFELNAFGFPNVPGHIAEFINHPTFTHIHVEEFGTTGPPNGEETFATFLIDGDLSVFEIQLIGGEQYVVGVDQEGQNFVTLGGNFRIIYSDKSGQEDLYQQDDTQPPFLPGFVNSQLGVGFDQYAVRITLEFEQ